MGFNYHIIQAQTAINYNGSTADGSAELDMNSSSTGILIPRMTAAQRVDITNPATGLLIFQIDGNMGFYFNSGTPVSPQWTELSSTLITQLADADGDTKVQLEESADEDKIRFDNGDTETMIIDSDGGVGIGVSPTNKKVHVFSGELQVDNMGADNLLLVKAGDSANYSNTATLGLVSGFGDNGYDHYSYIRCINNGTNGTGESSVNLTFGKTINNLSDVEFMRLTSDGQLGIGTTSPDPSAIVDISSTSM